MHLREMVSRAASGVPPEGAREDRAPGPIARVRARMPRHPCSDSHPYRLRAPPAFLSALTFCSSIASLPASTLTFSVLPLPSSSCHQESSYSPAGRPVILKLPSAPVTAQLVASVTITVAFIQVW